MNVFTPVAGSLVISVGFTEEVMPTSLISTGVPYIYVVGRAPLTIAVLLVSPVGSITGLALSIKP